MSESKSVSENAVIQSSVVIIGAGLSGLSSAVYLTERGVDVCVLEASERVGGRLFTKEIPGYGPVDVGGAYVGPTQHYILNLAKELGVSTYNCYDDGDIVYCSKGARRVYSDMSCPPTGSVISMAECTRIFRKLDLMAEEKAPKAEEWDKQTFSQWCRSELWTEGAKREADMFPLMNVAAQPHAGSLLHVLWYTKGAGGVESINGTTGGAQERKLVGGAQQIPIKLAEKLGGKVYLNQPVVSIDQNGEVIQVKTSNGLAVQAQYVVVAMAPPMYNRILFTPFMPAMKLQLSQRMPMGSVIKTITYYKQAFWRQKGLNGALFNVNEDLDLPVDFTMDDCSPDGSTYAIMGFISGDKALRLSHLTREQRRDLISKQYAKQLNCPELLNPVHYEELNWCEAPWSGGCYTTYCPPGVITSSGSSLRDPVGNVHFAGTETAAMWSGYMDGAIQAGHRAANEILVKMGLLDADTLAQDDSFERSHQQKAEQKQLSSFKRLASLAVLAGVGGLALYKFHCKL